MLIDRVGSAVDGSLVTTHQVCVEDADQYLIPTSTDVRGVKKSTHVRDMKQLSVETVRSTRRILTWISVPVNALVSITFIEVTR